MFSAEEIMSTIEDLTDRQWQRLFESKQKADPFLSRPEEVAVTTEINVYRELLKDFLPDQVEL